ncbi:hypothetical protein MHBO_000717 [Bonamia ostreae]|uniref:Uncharacterized protein n=1 Tax=Bonamia ostreae TaxID=126728 RepID=A0ABV2AGK7_9EUKA
MENFGLYLFEPIDCADIFEGQNSNLLITALAFTVDPNNHQMNVIRSLENLNKVLKVEAIENLRTQIDSSGLSEYLLRNDCFWSQKRSSAMEKHTMQFSTMVLKNEVAFICRGDVTKIPYLNQNECLISQVRIPGLGKLNLLVDPLSFPIKVSPGIVLFAEKTGNFNIYYWYSKKYYY